MDHRLPLLANENFPGPAIARLRSGGYDLRWVAELAAGMSDDAVMTLAAQEMRWLLTFDRDYGELVFRGERPLPPAVVLFRMPSYAPSDPAGWVERVLASAEARQGGFFVFDPRGLRWRAFPARDG